MGKSQQFVKNSKHLADGLAGLHLETSEVLVSHGVISLFTNAPLTVIRSDKR